jgi:hypothetical protein
MARPRKDLDCCSALPSWPDQPEIAEAADVSLQFSGHAHLGRFWPWSWMTRRFYRQFGYGLSRIGKMQILLRAQQEPEDRPFRLGPNPEIAVLPFQ